jgi:hypothetical protein
MMKNKLIELNNLLRGLGFTLGSYAQLDEKGKVKYNLVLTLPDLNRRNYVVTSQYEFIMDLDRNHTSLRVKVKPSRDARFLDVEFNGNTDNFYRWIKGKVMERKLGK